jgi:ketosteroid isomerase-like protein
MGTYSISVTPEGAEPMGYSGAYINAMEKVDGEWKIAGTMSNYDAPPPEDWTWNPVPEGDPPPDAPSYPELIEAYEAAFNSGDAAAVAALYTDDARVSYSNGPILSGPAEVQASMAERMTEGATIEIHEVGSQDMGGGLTGAGGWYQITGPDGMAAQTGYWMNVMRAQPDGSQKVVWTLTNARPAGM